MAGTTDRVIRIARFLDLSLHTDRFALSPWGRSFARVDQTVRSLPIDAPTLYALANPGEACAQVQDCAMDACCTCPGGAKMFSAAACQGTCRSTGETCQAALEQTGICD